MLRVERCSTAPTDKMPRPRKTRKQRVQVAHLKYAAVTSTTLNNYRKAVFNFFRWLDAHGAARPHSHAELDRQFGEYLNFLFTHDEPMYLGTNAMSGLKKLYPSCRKALEVSSQLLKNWSRTIIRERAIPLPFQFTKALAAVALRQGDEKFCVALLLGRIMEAVSRVNPLRRSEFRRRSVISLLVRFGSGPIVGVTSLRGCGVAWAVSHDSQVSLVYFVLRTWLR